MIDLQTSGETLGGILGNLVLNIWHIWQHTARLAELRQDGWFTIYNREIMGHKISGWWLTYPPEK